MTNAETEGCHLMRWASSVRTCPAKNGQEAREGRQDPPMRSRRSGLQRQSESPKKTHREVQRIGRERERVDRNLHRSHEEAARARKRLTERCTKLTEPTGESRRTSTTVSDTPASRSTCRKGSPAALQRAQPWRCANQRLREHRATHA